MKPRVLDFYSAKALMRNLKCIVNKLDNFNTLKTNATGVSPLAPLIISVGKETYFSNIVFWNIQRVQTLNDLVK
jgi:hypothetical protein